MEFHQEEEEEALNSPSDSDDDDDYVDEDREEEVEEEEEDDNDDVEEEASSSSSSSSSHVIQQSGSSPFMVIHHGRNNCMQTIYSISNGIYSVRRLPEMLHGMTCCASSHGWLLMLDNYSVIKRRRSCFLLNLMTSMEKIELPPMKSSYRYINCILTSSPPDCLIMFVSAQDNTCLFCRPKDHKWTLKVLGPKENHHGINGFKYLLDGSVSCKGKIYISFDNGSSIKILNYTLEDERKIGNGRFMVEKIKFETNLLDQFETFHNSEISTDLVESCGDVYMVVRIFLGGSDDVSTLDVYTFNVFKLDSSFLASSNNGGWKKVESLGDDRVFFVDKKCSLSASASKTGLMANHIYFFQSYDLRYMYKFKMGSGLITNTLCCPHLVHPVDDPYWML